MEGVRTAQQGLAKAEAAVDEARADATEAKNELRQWKSVHVGVFAGLEYDELKAELKAREEILKAREETLKESQAALKAREAYHLGLLGAGQSTAMPQPQVPAWIFSLVEDALFDIASSLASTSTRRQFKADVLEFYDSKSQQPGTGIGSARCALLNVNLSSCIVVAAHLFPKAKSKYFEQIFGLHNINDARNGLPLFKAFEHAYDRWQIMLVPKGQTVTMQILNPALKNTTFKEYLSQVDRNLLVHLPLDLENQTFGRYDGKDLVYKTPSMKMAPM
ncbi:hypothetical protein HDU98_000057 [Podochytrium sp. JEL0797]|nr:hypothetical protein HDU98_000057 [Podochytrium sp. JEL0797]